MTISVRQASPISVISANATSISCTLPSAPVSGNRLVWLLAVDKNAGTFTQPSGFTTRESVSASSISLLVAEKVSNGSESGAISASWTSSLRPKAILIELQASGGASIVYDDSNINNTETAGTSLGTNAATAGASAPFALLVWANDSAKANPADPDPTGSWSGGFGVYDEDWTASSGVGEPGFVVGYGAATASASNSSTYSHDGASDQMAAAIIIFSETGGGGGSAANYYYQQNQ